MRFDAKSGTVGVSNGQNPPPLADSALRIVIEAWPILPAETRVKIVRLATADPARLVKDAADDRSQALGRVGTLVTDLVQAAGFNVSPLGFTTPGPVAYKYWGTNEVHEVALVNKKSLLQNRFLSVNSSLAIGTNPFASLDPLGRRSVVEWNRRIAAWLQGNVLQSSTKVGLDLRYDLNDRLIDERNRLQTTVNDHAFRYDRLDRVIKHERGKVLAPATISLGSTRLHQRWSLDQAANWRNLQRSNLDSGQHLTQQRTHSRSNHVTSIQRTSGPVWATPAYDAEGNMTFVPSPKTPQSRLACKYDAWNRLTEAKDPTTGALNRYEYDGLGRRTTAYNSLSGDLRHFYYDQAGRVVTEYLGPIGQLQLDREYLWDANAPGRLACRIRQTPQGEERLYPLYDGQGNVVAVVDDEGEVRERYRYDVQGNVEYLDEGFARKGVQDTSVAWQHLFGGLRRDAETGLYFGGGYYHAGLGRLLPRGAVSVFSEGYLNSRAAGFPFGTPQPPGASAFARNFEPILQWISERPKWVKVGIGVAGYLVAAGVIAAQATSPTILLSLAGAAYGGLGGAVEASLSGGDYADVIMVSGLGAAFGAICPFGAIGAFAGGSAAALTMAARGADKDTIATAYQWGSLVGGLGGDFTSGALTAGRFLTMRALRAGLTHVGPDLLGAGVGAIIGYSLDHSSTGALHGATMGMMAGGLSGAAARGLWGLEEQSALKVFHQSIIRSMNLETTKAQSNRFLTTFYPSNRVFANTCGYLKRRSMRNL